MRSVILELWERSPVMRALVGRRIDVLGGKIWEGVEMKGMKPGGKPGKGGVDQTDQLLRVIDAQSRVIEALAQAVMAAQSVGGEGENEEENGNEDGEEKEEDK